MDRGPEPERDESLGALLARLIEDARALAKAELALFRADFYRRIARARIGALLLLIGAIMGQAAAVTFLVTLSFVLTPWIGRLGGSLVSVALGLGLAIVLIKVGVRKLMLVVIEPEEDEDGDGLPDRASPLDQLFERVRQRSRVARDHLSDTLGETQARLHPQALIADLADEIVDQAQALAHRMADVIRRKPIKTGAAALVVALLLVRPPIGRILAGLGRATTRGSASFKAKKLGRKARSDEQGD